MCCLNVNIIASLRTSPALSSDCLLAWRLGGLAAARRPLISKPSENVFVYSGVSDVYLAIKQRPRPHCTESWLQAMEVQCVRPLKRIHAPPSFHSKQTRNTINHTFFLNACYRLSHGSHRATLCPKNVAVLMEPIAQPSAGGGTLMN